ncbi:hypothetical protein E3P99_02736 [Wallemia hederae]|uniref:Uncharacterized protein n=1 Tax=Wallemia hederae TaxID=1540922 RepID=A0A4T0FIB1_9BASI|nr:hypothetical protein E3P99_02736 [Wallemia hederae]
MTSCLKCRKPITIDPSLEMVGSTSLNMVKSSLSSLNFSSPASSPSLPNITHNASGTAGTPSSRNIVSKNASNLNDSYIQVNNADADTDADPDAQESPSVIRMKLFALLSTKSDLKQPMCMECANMALDLLTNEFDDLKRERDAYISFEGVAETLKKDIERNSDDQLAEKEIERLSQLQTDTATKQTQLDSLLLDKSRLDEEMKGLDEEEEELHKQEVAYLRRHSARVLERKEEENELLAEQHTLNHANKELGRLERTNVWADVFRISSDSGIGTICGLRLGRMNQNVEWSEINAAWGHVAFLLYSVSNRLNIELNNARVIPLGSFSKIDKATMTQGSLKWETLELYHPGSALSMLHTRRFDQAMVAVLDVVKQMMDEISRRDVSVRWPYKINRDKIGDNSIRLPSQFTTDKTVDEEWTRALRGVLGTCKVIVQWTTST